MLKLTWKILSSPDAIAALNKLYNCDKMDFADTYSAGRLADSCRSQMLKAHDRNMEILKKWAKKDEKGELLTPVNGEFHFEEGNKEKYENEVSQLANNEFEAKGNKISWKKIPSGLLTGAEAVAITDLIEGVEELY